MQLAARQFSTLEIIVESLVEYDQTLPRFHEYIRYFGHRQLTGSRLERSIVCYYEELLGQCVDYHNLLRRSKIGMLDFKIASTCRKWFSL